MSRRAKAIAAALIAAPGLALAFAPAAGPAPAPFEIEAGWRSETEPGRMWIERGPDRVDLAKQGAAYRAQTAHQELTSSQALLVAQFGTREVSLPIRFTPAKPKMAFTVQDGPVVPCTDAQVRRLEAPGPTYTAQVDAYFRARRLAKEGDCGSIRQRVVKAWFDRSFALADSHDHITLDVEAKDELMKYPGQANYASVMASRALTRLVQIDYGYQQALVEDGAWAEAAEVNAALVERLDADQGLALAAAQYQGVTDERLTLDRDFIEARATVAEAAAGPE